MEITNWNESAWIMEVNEEENWTHYKVEWSKWTEKTSFPVKVMFNAVNFGYVSWLAHRMRLHEIYRINEMNCTKLSS